MPDKKSERVNPLDKKISSNVKDIYAGTPHPKPAPTYFRPLGHNRDRLYFITSAGQQLLSFKAQQLSHKSILFLLAPMQWWEREFFTENGFTGKAVDMAVNYLLRECQTKGVFRPEQMRGRGAWWDAGRLVIHAGDKLYVDGVETGLADIESKWVYEAASHLSVDIENPLDYEEAYKFFQLCRMLNWENPLYGILAAGWTVVSLACGALPWRPHIWVTGPSGCGKSWLVKQIQSLFGEFCLAAKGETTEAGLRQKMQYDALPVTHDEAEGEDERTARNMDRLLGLIRQSSADVDGEIFKGGAEGDAQGYQPKSSFLMSSIRVPLKQRADESRISVLTLRKNTEDDRGVFQETIIPLSEEISDPEYARRFRARVFANLSVLRANTVTFSNAIGLFFGNQRLGDQLGPMVAGAYLLHNNNRISIEQAAEWMKKHDWSDQLDLSADSDEQKCLTSILEAKANVQDERIRIEMTIGEMIRMIAVETHDQVPTKTAEESLARVGVRVNGDMLLISNTHSSLERLLRQSPWGTGWGRILKRIDGAQSVPVARFGATRSRATAIPLPVVLGTDQEAGQPF